MTTDHYITIAGDGGFGLWQQARIDALPRRSDAPPPMQHNFASGVAPVAHALAGATSAPGLPIQIEWRDALTIAVARARGAGLRFPTFETRWHSVEQMPAASAVTSLAWDAARQALVVRLDIATDHATCSRMLYHELKHLSDLGMPLSRAELERRADEFAYRITGVAHPRMATRRW